MEIIVILKRGGLPGGNLDASTNRNIHGIRSAGGFNNGSGSSLVVVFLYSVQIVRDPSVFSSAIGRSQPAKGTGQG